MTSTDDDSGVFDRSMEAVPDGGSLVGDLRRALIYPFTMTAGTFVKGGLLVLASFLYLPVPLLFGYAVAGARRASGGEPLAGFADWQYQYVTGLALALLLGAALLAPLLPLAVVVGVATGGGGGDALGTLIGLWWFYGGPWAIGVYGTGSWREFTRRPAWRWLVSPNYVATWLLAAVAFVVAYVLLALSAITIVGPLFLAFYLTVAFWVLLGGRYDTYRAALGDGADAGSAVDLRAAALDAIDAVPLDEWADRATTDDSGPAEADGVGSEGTGSDETDAADTGVAGTSDDDPGEYASLLDRATTLDSTGPVERLAADDDVRFHALAADARTEAGVEAFEAAVGRWRNLSNAPEVATVLDEGDEPGPWVAFDPADGPLSAVGGDLAPSGVVAVLEDIEEAIATGRIYNVAHGELTPDCVFVEREGGTASARERVSAAVSDWGVDRTVRDAVGDSTAPTRYLAPEQRTGGPPDRAVDVYQVAAVAHYALFGEPPYAAVDDDELADPDGTPDWSPPDGHYVGDAAATTLERGLAFDTDERHDATGDFVRELRNALE